MANTEPRVVGEPFEDYVNSQIEQRQKVYGSGMGSTRTSDQISYLNSRNAFIKAVSSVSLNGEVTKRIGIGSANLEGIQLAKNYVLFNTVGGLKREGVATSNSLINNFSYGLGGTEFGIQPPPGIISFDIKHINRGSIRRGELSLKAYNKSQFDIIETLYMRLGFSILIEWGHNKYLTDDGQVKTIGTTLSDGWWWNNNSATIDAIGVQNKISSLREKYYGSYDAAFMRVVNFNWNYNTDGSYDINISMLSLGSIVESFKVNTLKNKATLINEDFTEENEENKCFLSNYLYNIRKDFKSLVENDPEFFYKKYIKVRERNYILFQELLEVIEYWIIDKTDNGSPLISLNYFPQILQNFIPNAISIDPEICLVNTKHVNIKGFDNSQIDFNEQTYDFVYSHNNKHWGNTSNIYLKFEFIDDILTSYDAGELDLFTFLQRICDGINSCFANIINLEPVFDEDGNCIEIQDQNLPVDIKLPWKQAGSSTPIIIYGYKDSKSNFVKDYKIETKIDSSILNMLSIGAAASNTSINEDATTFSKWNKGIIDRFQLGRVEDTGNSESKSSYSIINTSGTVQSTLQSSLQNNSSTTIPITPPKTAWENWVYKSFTSYFGRFFNQTSQIIYFSGTTNKKASGKALLSEYAKSLNKKELEEKGEAPSKVIGFIPLELDLTLDGLSGMKIYNQIKIESEFLPSNYPDIMEFVVTGLGHSIKDQDWTTTVSAIPKSTSSPVKENDKEEFQIEPTISNLTFK